MSVLADQRFPPLTVTHLSDSCAELTLQDLLQRLELVTGDVTRLLQLLQQLDSPGNIWQKEGGDRMGVSICVWVLMPRGQREKMPHSITLTAQPCERRWSESMGGIMEIDLVKASWGKKDRIAVPSMGRLHWFSSMHKNKG